MYVINGDGGDDTPSQLKIAKPNCVMRLAKDKRKGKRFSEPPKNTVNLFALFAGTNGESSILKI